MSRFRMYLYATFFVAQAAMAQHEGFVAPYHVREQAGTSLESRLQSYLEDKELKKNADGGDDFQTLAVTPKSSKAEKQWMAQTFVDDLVMSLGCEDGMQRQIYFDRSKKIISLMGDVGVSIPSLKHYLYTRLKARCAEANEAKDLNTVNYCASQLYENTVMSIDTMFSEYPKRIKAEYGKGFDSGKHIEKWLGVEGKDMTSAYQEQMDRIRTVLRELRGDRNKNSTETPPNPTTEIKCDVENRLATERMFPKDGYTAPESFTKDIHRYLVASPALLEFEEELEGLVQDGVGREALYHAMNALVKAGGFTGESLTLPAPEKLMCYHKDGKKNCDPARGAKIATASFDTTRPYLTVVDYSKSSSGGAIRKFLIDLNGFKLVRAMSTSHGSRSDSRGRVVSWSDKSGAHKSTPGLFVTGESYDGKHGLSMRLYGLESLNQRMYENSKVVHQAGYVRDGQQCGASWGCPALSGSNLKWYINKTLGKVDEGRPSKSQAGHITGTPYYIYIPFDVPGDVKRSSPLE